MKFRLEIPSPATIMKAFTDHHETMARAASSSMRQAAEIAKQRGRTSMRVAGPGFAGRWPNALRADSYPRKGKSSVRPAALVYIKSDYAGIFEYGGDITGSPYLWLPLEGAKKGRGRKIKPRDVRGLFSLRRPGKAPLLAVRRRRGGKWVTVPMFVGVPRVHMPKKWGVIAAVRYAQAQLPKLYAANFGR